MTCASFCISSQCNSSSVPAVQQCLPTRPQDAVLNKMKKKIITSVPASLADQTSSSSPELAAVTILLASRTILDMSTMLSSPVRGQATTSADLPALLGSLMLLSQQVPLGGSHAPATLLLSHLGLPGSDLRLHLLPTAATTERQ